MSDLKWYIVRAISGQEKKAKSYLESEVSQRNFTDFIPQILIPTEKVYEMRNGKKKIREKNFLPGYIIIQADLTNGEVLPLITNIPGIIGFLGDEKAKDGRGKKPVPMRESEVQRMLGDADEEEVRMDKPFVVGESVKVMDGGPFNGFTGTIEKVFEERQKVNVMVKIFGRNTPVELSYNQVEREE